MKEQLEPNPIEVSESEMRQALSDTWDKYASELKGPAEHVELGSPVYREMEFSTFADQPVKKPTKLKPVHWLDSETAKGNVDKNIVLLRGQAFTIHDVSVMERLSRAFNKLGEEGIVEPEVDIRVAKTATRILVNDRPVLDVHAWVPTKKTLVGSHHDRKLIPATIEDRLPLAAKAFLMHGEIGSILSFTRKYLGRDNKFSREESEYIPAFALSLLDYSTWSYESTADGDILRIEIHGYGKRRIAFQFVIYLEDK